MFVLDFAVDRLFTRVNGATAGPQRQIYSEMHNQWAPGMIQQDNCLYCWTESREASNWSQDLNGPFWAVGTCNRQFEEKEHSVSKALEMRE